jgi:Family of unknown function (DUF6069)
MSLKTSELWKKGVPMAIAASVGINVILYEIGLLTHILDDKYGVPNPDGSIQSITLVPVIMASILPVIVGALILMLLSRLTGNAWRVFTIIAVAFTLISLTGPFMQIKDIPTGMAVLLDVMHFVVAGSVLYFFRRCQVED